MANKQSVNYLSGQRVDIPDLRAIESGVIFDFKSLLQSFVGSNPYILKGFTIPVAGISGPATSLQMVVDGAIVWIPSDSNGSFLRVETGTPNEILSPANAKVIGSFSPGANYVGIQFLRATDATTNDLVSVWDVDSASEFTVTAPRGLVLSYQIVINGSSFGNTSPVAIVNVSGSNVTSIENAKTGLFRLGTGGISPDPYNSFSFSVNPENNLLATSNSSPDPFAGGDWELDSFKKWMDAVMTQLKNIKGTAYWYFDGGSAPTDLSLAGLWFDTAGSVITGTGKFIHSNTTPGELSWTSDVLIRSILGPLTLIISEASSPVTLADGDVAYITIIRDNDFQPANSFTFTNGSTTVSGTINVSGISPGDWIKLNTHSVMAYAQVQSIAGSNITLETAYVGANSVGKALKTVGTYAAQVASPTGLPNSGDMYWLAKRDDNAFTPLTIETIINSGLTRTTDVSTVKTVGSHGLVEGQAITIAGASDTTFNGRFDVISIVSGTQFTVNNPGGDVLSGVAGNGTVSSTPRLYLRLGHGELEQGEEIQIDDDTILNILRFIGAQDETDTSPPYTQFPNGLAPFSYSSASSLTQAISATTGNVNSLLTVLDQSSYDEPLTVVSGAPASDNEVTGPVSSGSTLTLPLNSRNGNAVQNYVVGKGYLQVYLNGQYLQLLLTGLGWSEIGGFHTPSNTITINQDLEIGDVLTFRISGPGGPGTGGGAPDDDFHNLPASITADNADEIPIWDTSAGAYRKQTRAIFLSGLSGNLSTTTKTANYTALSTDQVILVNATGGNVTIALPAAATVAGHVYYIKKIDSSGNSVIIDPNGAETIDGASTVTTTTQYESFTIVSDGVAWFII